MNMLVLDFFLCVVHLVTFDKNYMLFVTAYTNYRLSSATELIFQCIFSPQSK